MSSWFDRIRHPVRRAGDETYLLLMLVSFGGTVILTRWYLALAGYPQIGSGELHIAHALWGGLLLFVASVLPLLWAGRTTYQVSAVLSGIGVGLFADEVGKFITARNDYFYPAALPIIYAVFLIGAVIYLRSRRPMARDARSQLHVALAELEEAVERDLEPSERDVIARRLTDVVQGAQSQDHRRLAAALLDYVTSSSTALIPERHGLADRIARWWRGRRERLLGHRGAKWLFAATLTVTGIWSLIAAGALVTGLVGVAVGATTSASPLETAQLFVEGFSGALLVPGIVLIALGRTQAGIRIASISLALALLVQDLIGFYLNQFDAVWSALFHLVLLVGLLALLRASPARPATEPGSGGVVS